MISDPYIPKSEMFWRPDPNVDAARKLPDWGEFHHLCGRSGLAFDHIERESRRGPYVADAFSMVKQSDGEWAFVSRGKGRGPDVLTALTTAYESSGIVVPGASEMLARRLGGTPRVAVAAPDFEELFG